MFKVFFDTEFTGLHKNTTLISIGLISEDNKQFYAELTDYEPSQVDEWIQTNVISKLKLKDYTPDDYQAYSSEVVFKGNITELQTALINWLSIVSKGEKIQMWSDCLAYDWVLFNHIFGGAMDIPKNISYIPMDISTMLELKGVDPDVNRETFVFGENWKSESGKHNALWDAKIIRLAYEKLMTL